MSMGLELDCSPESPDGTQHTWLTDFEVWDLGRAFYPQNYDPKNSCGFEFSKCVAIAYKAREK